MELIKLLIVDDEPGIRSGVSRVLRDFSVSYPFMDEACKFEIIEAPTGEDAIEIINNNLPDIMLLDNKLPGIQGIEVLEYVSKNHLDIVVVMITSYASLEVAVKATKNGAFDFIPKPFTPQELRSSMETITKQVYFRRMTKKLNTAGKQIRFQFLSVLSHELKAPLNAIEGYLKMMEEKQYGENIDDYQQIVERSIARVKGMRSLIMDLLDLTKIESGSTTREIKEVNLIEIAQVSVDSMKPFAIQNDVNVYLNSHNKIIIKADAREMEIVFNNLISNAIKYNRAGGRVDCAIKPKDDFVVFTISDNGIGMSEDDMSKLFNEFVRIKNQRTKGISGSGLGLSIVKKIIDAYDGDITVTSSPDKGTTFTVTLPIKL
ncbi:MAG: hybrid sensor histidine kinase/response regulator [Bacteroidetes bacterium]|nr:hybrid sensor histidine kinase/response regulator [Bacteroidota bacterium]